MADRERMLFTSEAVSEGHPDKVADQVSDAVVDAYIAGDPESRVACETLVTTDYCLVAGEVTSKARDSVDVEQVVRDTIREIGYVEGGIGFDYRSCRVDVRIDPQSEDISQGVTEGRGLFKEQGAGDQGMMFGYACDETPELMPTPIVLAQKLVEELAKLRKASALDYIRPDSKSQVTVEYADGRPVRIDSLVISTQHHESVAHSQIHRDVLEQVVRPVVPSGLLDDRTRYYVNPTGKFVRGGPQGDTGLTGRKIIVDTYGGWARHGGGAFSGKDPSKVDRSAAYAARYVAKNIVAAKLAGRCEVQLAYAIGVAQPVSILVDTFGTGKLSGEELVKVVREAFDLRPKGIIDALSLKRPIFRATAAYGHFGRPAGADGSFSWEKTDRAEALGRLARSAASYGRGSEMTGEDLSKLVSLLKERLQRVHKETAWNNSNRTWTRNLKSALAELANDQRVPSAPPGCKRSVWASGACNAREEWLYDLCWLDYKDGFLIGMPLAAESEWLGPDDVFDDFQKLVQSRADVRLMIYDGEYKGQEELICSFRRQISDFADSNQKDRYLLAAFTRDEVKFVSLDGKGKCVSETT